MTKAPLVSIIIPTYNRAHLIGETLDSVLAQTYTNWECIVVDDGSTDGTDQLMAAYCAKNARFQYHHRPADRLPGGNAARNYGFEVSKGEYIQWFDSDDVMHDSLLSIKIKQAINFNCDVVIDVGATLPIHTLKQPINESTVESRNFKSDTFYIDFILGKQPVVTNNVMLKRSIIGDERFNEQLFKAQEYEYFSRLFEQDLQYGFLDLGLFYYRDNGLSISRQKKGGSKTQHEALIYLSKLLMQRHANKPLIVARAERQGRKTYKNIALQRDCGLIFKHFQYFRRVHHKSSITFFWYIVVNVFFKKGFDRIKPTLI